ncbi:MAG: pseudaminic acid synthase [Candidatus Micrarchaeota archaeon]
MKIGNRKVGPEEPCLMIAEISCNHLQKKDYALMLIEAAKGAGADAVKFQTYTPDTMTIDCDNDYFKIKGTVWDGMSLYQLYKEAYTPWDWFPELKDRAAQEGLIFFSTPFDPTAVDFLEKMDVQLYKIASFEVNDIPLIKRVARTGKPVIFSTGLATEEDIQLAVDTIRGEGNEDIMIMKCTSAYPAPLSEMNLRTIPDIAERFGTLVGLSDHSMSETAAVAAYTLGASAVEKHFIIDRKEGGHDAKFSLEPEEFKRMVKSVREAEEALGEVRYAQTDKVKEHDFVRRSIFVVKDIVKGTELTADNIRVIRPGYGMHPKHYEEVIGKKAKADIKRGTPLGGELIE